MDPLLGVLLKPLRSLSDDSGFTVDSDTKVTGMATGVLLPVMLIPEGEMVDWEVGRGASGFEERAPGEVEREREARESREC